MELLRSKRPSRSGATCMLCWMQFGVPRDLLRRYSGQGTFVLNPRENKLGLPKGRRDFFAARMGTQTWAILTAVSSGTSCKAKVELIALVRADEAGSVGDETEMVDLGGIAAAAVAERVPAALAAGVDIQFARRKASLPFLALSTRPHSIAICVGN